jgi:hypothetical protein
MTRITDPYWVHKRHQIIHDCENPTATGYDRIGARGIKMNPRWRQRKGGLANFYEDIMAGIGPRPSPEHGLTRIDEGRDFEIDNMAWLTKVERAALRKAQK